MIRPKFSKNQITEKIIEKLKEQNIPTPAYHMDITPAWWFGRGEGLRLSDEGQRIFKLLNIEYYEYPILFKKNQYSYYGFLIDLGKKITCPYYLHNINLANEPTIRLYDSEIAMMVSLFGSIEEYLNSLDER